MLKLIMFCTLVCSNLQAMYAPHTIFYYITCRFPEHDDNSAKVVNLQLTENDRADAFELMGCICRQLPAMSAHREDVIQEEVERFARFAFQQSNWQNRVIAFQYLRELYKMNITLISNDGSSLQRQGNAVLEHVQGKITLLTRMAHKLDKFVQASVIIYREYRGIRSAIVGSGSATWQVHRGRKLNDMRLMQLMFETVQMLSSNMLENLPNGMEREFFNVQHVKCLQAQNGITEELPRGYVQGYELFKDTLSNMYVDLRLKDYEISYVISESDYFNQDAFRSISFVLSSITIKLQRIKEQIEKQREVRRMAVQNAQRRIAQEAQNKAAQERQARTSQDGQSHSPAGAGASRRKKSWFSQRSSSSSTSAREGNSTQDAMNSETKTGCCTIS